MSERFGKKPASSNEPAYASASKSIRDCSRFLLLPNNAYKILISEQLFRKNSTDIPGSACDYVNLFAYLIFLHSTARTVQS